MTGELMHVGHHKGLGLFPSRATDALTLLDAVAGHRTLEGSQLQAPFLDHIEADPKERWKLFFQQGCYIAQGPYYVVYTIDQTLCLCRQLLINFIFVYCCHT